MKHDQPAFAQSLGADLRALRKARGLTLTQLAEALGRSVGWLSQVERELSTPSINDLRDLARSLDVSVSSFFQTQSQAIEGGHVVRHNERRPIGSREAGLVEELLSPDLTDEFEMVHSTFEPGAELAQYVTRPTQEVGYIIAGKLDLWIDTQKFELQTGDSFRIRGEPFRWANPYPQSCRAVWVIAPPVY